LAIRRTQPGEVVWSAQFERALEKSAAIKEHAILKALSTRDRNAVHVALWTLEQNGIPISPAISFAGLSY
jgi:hypothetical protein